jgi:hypothetical protein
MPIPNDPLDREWIELSGANPHLVDEFRPALFGMLAFSPDKEPAFAGSAFITAAAPGYALALSAKHVLLEGVTRIQRPYALHAPSSLFASRQRAQPRLEPSRLKASWMGSETSNLMNVWHLSYNETLDIACLLIGLQNEHAQRFQPTLVPVDTAIPAVGDIVQMVALDTPLVTELKPPDDPSGYGQEIKTHKRTSIRLGVVTGVHANGLRHYGWPCFTTSIPAEPGMSGGLVSIFGDNKTVAACGIVCADNSSIESRKDQRRLGESVVACTWPALALTTLAELSASQRVMTLYEMMKSGAMPTALGIECVEVADRGGGDYAAVRKPIASERL